MKKACRHPTAEYVLITVTAELGKFARSERSLLGELKFVPGLSDLQQNCNESCLGRLLCSVSIYRLM